MSDFEKKILVIDDDLLFLKLVKVVLNKAGFTAHTFSNPENGVKFFKDNEVSLVLLDFYIPGFKDLEIFHKLKKIKSNIDVIFLTASSDKSIIEKVFESGAKDYLKKPFHNKEFIARINNVINTFELQKKNNELLEELLDDLTFAGKVQEQSMAPAFILNEKFMTTSLFMPCMSVGGDIIGSGKFKNEKILHYIGDVSGHGVQASLVGHMVNSHIKNLLVSKDQISVPMIAKEVNSLILTSGVENHITMIFLVLDELKNTVEIYNFGHPRPIVLDKDQRIYELDVGGAPPLGWFEDFDFINLKYFKSNLNHYDGFLLFSDGIDEIGILNEKGQKIEVDVILKNFLSDDRLYSVPQEFLNYFLSKELNLSHDDIAISWIFRHRKNLFLIDPSIDSISGSIQEIIGYAKSENITDDTVFSLQLVLSEYLYNIPKHGFKNSESIKNKSILVIIDLSQDNINIKILDHGAQWSLESAVRCEDDLAEGGRGLNLIEQISKVFKLKRLHDLNFAEIILPF